MGLAIFMFQVVFVIAQLAIPTAVIWWAVHRLPRYRAYDRVLRAVRAGNVTVTPKHPMLHATGECRFFWVTIADDQPSITFSAAMRNSMVTVPHGRFRERDYICPNWSPRSITGELDRRNLIPEPASNVRARTPYAEVEDQDQP